MQESSQHWYHTDQRRSSAEWMAQSHHDPMDYDDPPTSFPARCETVGSCCEWPSFGHNRSSIRQPYTAVEDSSEYCFERPLQSQSKVGGSSSLNENFDRSDEGNGSTQYSSVDSASSVSSEWMFVAHTARSQSSSSFSAKGTPKKTSKPPTAGPELHQEVATILSSHKRYGRSKGSCNCLDALKSKDDKDGMKALTLCISLFSKYRSLLQNLNQFGPDSKTNFVADMITGSHI